VNKCHDVATGNIAKGTVDIAAVTNIEIPIKDKES
jgi:hypothetical protein